MKYNAPQRDARQDLAEESQLALPVAANIHSSGERDHLVCRLRTIVVNEASRREKYS